MIINTKALLITIYFIIMLPLSFISRRWLWVLICQYGGTTPKEVRKKSEELVRDSMGGGNLQTVFEAWLRKNSSNPNKVSNLLVAYKLCMLPNMVFLFFSFLNLRNPNFIRICIVGMIIVPIVSIVLIIVGIYNKRRH